VSSRWLRPVVRLGAALVLPFVVPGLITALIWALPGDPASIICPPEICSGTEALAERWNLDRGPWYFFSTWMADAVQGDFGNSWRLQQGFPVGELLEESIPTTAALVSLGLLLLILGATGAATRWLPAKLDPLFQAVGLVPAVVMAMTAAAALTVGYGVDQYSDGANLIRLGLGALALGLADAALSGTVTGVRGLMESERKQRYVQMAILRGEGALHNALPNTLPALAGQMRARTLHLLSGAVVVEVVLQINGLGDLLWGGTLAQDFGVVLAASFGFAVLSAVLLLMQSLVEIGTELHVRRSPSGVAV
jgi:peptide/nickel transport system permease protein